MVHKDVFLRFKVSLRAVGKQEFFGGFAMLSSALFGLFLANSPLSSWYFSAKFFSFHKIFPYTTMTTTTLIQDGLLTVFFFIVGIELKREFIDGDLRDRKHALLPVFCAAGGMIAPALICIGIGWGLPGVAQASTIPIATDITLVLAVLSLVNRNLPPSLRTFLLSIAVLDDLGSIIVIAVKSFSKLDFVYLSLFILIALFYWFIQRNGFNYIFPCLLLAAIAWFFLHHSGIHATLSGFILGFATSMNKFKENKKPIIDKLEGVLLPLSTIFCVPVFAFFSSGIKIHGNSFISVFSDRLALAVGLGLLLGKIIGISGAAALAIKLSLAHLPPGMNTRHLPKVGLLCGTGFTISLFITELSFGGTPQGDRFILAVLLASLIASVCGAISLRLENHTRF